MRIRHVSALMLVCLAISPPLSSAEYRYLIFNFPGAESTRATGINAGGDIVGGYIDAAGVSHGFLRQQGVFMSIDVPGAVYTLSARAINARGDIVGNFVDSNGVHGFLLSDGLFTQTDFPESLETLTSGINDAGDITGHYVDAAADTRGFILKSGVFYRVQVPKGALSRSHASQDNGWVIVGQTETIDGGVHGFVRKSSGEYELIDYPGLPFPCTGARGINQRGDIVGGFSETECDADAQLGFVLRDGHVTRLAVPGAIATQAFGINDDGVIVGRIMISDGTERGFKAVPEE